MTDGAFRGRAAIVTGASSGIGRAIADHLAREGADLCLVAAPDAGRDLDEAAAQMAATGVRAIALAADVGDPETAERAVGDTLEAYGRLDHLASNAGIAYFDEALSEPLEHFDHTMHVNVRGMYLMTHASARAMATHDGGTIVCTASTASIAGEEHQVAYNASKGAVSQLARSLAIDLAPYGIRVNAVCPGIVAGTEMRTRVDAEARALGRPTSTDRVGWIPMGRLGEAEDVAGVVAFLASDDARYMTGQALNVTGGLWMH